MKIFWIALIVILLLIPPTLIAGAATTNVLNSTGFTTDTSYLATSAQSVKFLAKSFFYIAVFFGLMFVIIKFILPRNISMVGSRQFKVLQKLPLEVQASLYLVQLGQKYLLISVGGKQVSLIKEVSKEELGDYLASLQSKANFEPFKAQLDKLLKGKKNEKA